MPETFGSGTAYSAFDPAVYPLVVSPFLVTGGGGTLDLSFPDPERIYLVTAIDMVTAAGGGDGTVTWSYFNGSEPFDFWVANTGTSVDTFSWRGWLPMLGGLGLQLLIQNGSGGNATGVVTGFELPAMPLS